MPRLQERKLDRTDTHREVGAFTQANATQRKGQ